MGSSNRRGMALSLTFRALILALTLVGWMATPALAAPQRITSDPEPGAQLPDMPARVTITFSEPLSQPSDIQVKDECKVAIDKGEAVIGGVLQNELSIDIASKSHGTFTVKYVATGVTGTTTESFTFVVHAGKPCKAADGEHEGMDGMDMGSGDGDTSGDGDMGSDMGDMGSGDEDMSSGMGDMGSAPAMGNMGSAPAMGNMGDGGGGGMDMGGSSDDDMDHMAEESDQVAVAADGPLPTELPTGSTALVALGLAVMLGVFGGWVLRVSTPS